MIGIAIALVASTSFITADIVLERANIIQYEEAIALGGHLQLKPNEEEANGFRNPEQFNLSKHYFTYKKDFANSKLYRIIKKMPKGAALHVHDCALIGPDYILNITYLEDLYFCPGHNSSESFFLFSSPKPPNVCPTEWYLMRDLRNSSDNLEKFDDDLRNQFTMVTEHPEKTLTNVNAAWKKFQNKFSIITPLLTYRPVWEQYFYDALLRFREDNVMYLEIRTRLTPLYDLEGSAYDEITTAQSIKKAVDRFVQDNPGFVGAKIIYAPNTPTAKDEFGIEHFIDTAKKLKRELGDFVAGFDLVGQEDVKLPLVDFLTLLTEAGSELTYFFHAGETNWYGASSDNNLVDAVLLGSRRIGHAYALLKHPLLVGLVRDCNIAIEVSVISNQVLKLVYDVRNHPLAQFLAQGLPVVLSSDDPGLWEAAPLSHDYYVALVGVAARGAALRTLKQLALNSLHYSALSQSEKFHAIMDFQQRWMRFIDQLVADTRGQRL